MHLYLAPPSQYFVEPPFAEITAASHFGDVFTSFAHLENEMIANFSWKNSSSSVRLDGEHLSIVCPVWCLIKEVIVLQIPFLTLLF